jgi:cell division protein FtsB
MKEGLDMKAKHMYYDRISQVRVLRGIIASLVFCIAVLLGAVFITGTQVEAMQEQVMALTAEVQQLSR